jgi:predicted nucleic acid-binding protein
LPIEANNVFNAGTLTAQHLLRGYDAVHLAVALNLHAETRAGVSGQGNQPSQEVLLMTFDKDLYRSAKAEGIAYILDAMEHPSAKS